MWVGVGVGMGEGGSVSAYVSEGVGWGGRHTYMFVI